MKATEKALVQFQELYQKQDLISKIVNKDLFEHYSNSDIHCIDIIGSNENANGTKIAKCLRVTKSAVSKIIKRLYKEELITSKQKADNKKEIYYFLTQKGEKIYQQHEEAHEKWRLRDLAFLQTMQDKEMEKIAKFLEEFNCYLSKIIEENEK